MGELVCSNSLKSETRNTAPWLLKEELRRGGSLLLRCAAEAAVPGGQALTVDRALFSQAIEAALAGHPGIEVIRQEVTRLPEDETVVLASGPLTSAPLAEELTRRTGQANLSFYDAISPIVDADSIQMDRVWAASRYGKGGDDYLNCPLDREQYDAFRNALLSAGSYPLHSFEEPRFFEACLPLEELARRGPETLRYGPMKPVGLRDPRTGREPYAAVQLRKENLRSDSFNLVGFQNHLRFGDQARILRMIPGLEQARFLRYGQVHRNTYVHAPAVLTSRLHLRQQPHLFIAGQLCGTEGYVEAIATGFLAGTFAARHARGMSSEAPPRTSALGSLVEYISGAHEKQYVPANMTFDLLPPLPEETRRRIRDKNERHRLQCEQALEAMEAWWSEHQPEAPAPV